MENELINVNNEDIKNLIYTIRGKQVILDSDVAMLYQTETRIINQTVKRNIVRFPEEFCFKLTENEVEKLKSQIFLLDKSNSSQFVMSSGNINRHRGKVYLPYVFTEQGIAMLSALLKSEIAIKMSINIMNAFVEMRKYIASNVPLYIEIADIKSKLIQYDNNFEKIFKQLKTEEIERQKIFFQGQIWDCYSLIIDIIKKAENKITIIDNYVDDSILKMLTKKNRGVEVVILTSNKTNIQNLDVQKFNKEYPTLKVAKTDKFHDRFIIIDNKELYHCGASIKDLGKKCFAINKLENEEFIELIKNII